MAKERVYHWTAAIRIEHWWHAAAMIALIATGFYIHSPYIAGGDDTMAWMRFIHFVSMYVLIFGFIVRVYLAFFSRTAADWKELFPLPRNLTDVPDMLAYYLFLKDTHKEYGRYNPLQGLVYFLMGVIILIMTATGFALYDGWLHGSFLWVNTLLGGDEVTRLVHFLGMWVLICMSVVHIYFVIRENVVSRDRTILSMVDGYKEM